jgi:hypothetical protein
MGCRPLPDHACQHFKELACYSTENNFTCGTTFDSPMMDPSCNWEGMPRQRNENLSDFCNGGMDMLMQGFESVNPSETKMCIILFFKAWTLNTRTKFAFACIGVAILGLSIEVLIALRRKITR